MEQSQRQSNAAVMVNVRRQQMDKIASAIMDSRDPIANTVSGSWIVEAMQPESVWATGNSNCALSSLDLNECAPNPCKNGGICVDGDGSFTCKCPSGWSGQVCSERVTQCSSGQCANGGSCAPTIISGDTTSICICASGWGGPFCTEAVDQCQGQPCHNGGTCESGPGWFRCVCAQGFSGPDCRINVNECSPQPCLGGATCIDGIGGFTCICPKGRRGTRCEICKYTFWMIICHGIIIYKCWPMNLWTYCILCFPSIIWSSISMLEYVNTIPVQCY